MGKERSALEAVVKTIENMDTGLSDAKDLLDMAVEENDEDGVAEVEADIDGTAEYPPADTVVEPPL